MSKSSHPVLAFCCCAVLFVVSVVGAFGKKSLVGAPQEIDVNDNEGAKDALTYAVYHHNLNSTSNFQSAVSKVLKAQSQVVEGVLYTFTVIMAKTNCTSNSVNEVCTIPQGPEDAQTCMCKFTVWSRPWLNSTIVNEACFHNEFLDSHTS